MLRLQTRRATPRSRQQVGGLASFSDRQHRVVRRGRACRGCGMPAQGTKQYRAAAWAVGPGPPRAPCSVQAPRLLNCRAWEPRQEAGDSRSEPALAESSRAW